MTNRRGKNNISQSAIDGVNVEGSLTIEKINQIVNLSDDDKYKYIESLKFEYRGKINEAKNTYRDAVRSLLKYLRQELRKLYRETENKINEKRDEIHKLEKKEKIIKEARKRYANEKERLRKRGSDEEPSDFLTNEEKAELGSDSLHAMILISDPKIELMERTASFLEGRKNPIEEAKDDLEDLEEDLEELRETIDSVSRFSKVDPANLDIDRIIQVNNFSDLNNIEELKRKYESEYKELTEASLLKEAVLTKERDLKIYKFQLVRYLHEDGFPLSQENSDALEDFLHDSVLDNNDIEEAGNQAARIFCQKNLESYEQIYSIKLSADGFPLSQESLNELDKLKESLGLTSLSFIKAEISSIETRQIQPYFKNKIRLYLELYQQKLEEYSLALDSSVLSELKALESSWKLKQFSFEGFDLNREKDKLIREAYKKALERYKSFYSEKLKIQGIKLNTETMSFLKEQKKSLGLTSYYIKLLNYEHVFSPEKEIEVIEENINTQFYKNKLSEFSLKPSQNLSIKNDYTRLGIREEDLEIVKGIIDKGWSIDHLIKDITINYWQLVKLLSKGEWKQANDFTLISLYKLVQQSENSRLSEKDLANISKKDVYTIDKIWYEYSHHHFGFSVQKQIFETLDKNKNKLFEQIGWKRQRSLNPLSSPFKDNAELTFSLDAPLGHLPAWNVRDKQVFDNSLPHFKVWEFDTIETSSDILSDLENMQRHYSEKDFWKKIQKFGKRAGTEVVEKVLTLYYAAQQDIPIAAKAAMLGAIGYFILPFDLISDFIPVAGWSDDLAALGAALTSAASYITPEVTKKVKDKMQELFGK